MACRVVMCVGLFLGVFGSCLGQSIHEEGGTANPFIRAIKDASGEYAGTFPVLSAAEPDGCLVVASGDFHNSDITIIVEKSRLDDLKPKVLELLKRLGLPNTYVRARRGRVIGSFDLEFNKYIRQNGNHSDSTIPLGAIVDIVKDWGMPRPMGVGIRGDKNWSVNFKGEDLQTMKLLSPKDVSPTDVVKVSADRHWYGLLAAIVLVGVFGFAMATLAKQAILGKPLNQTLTPPPPQTLVEAQTRYDARNTKKSVPRPFFVLAVTGGMVAQMPALMRDAFNWMPAPNRWMPWFVTAMFSLMLASIAGPRFRNRSGPKIPMPRQLKILGLLMVPVFLLTNILFVQMFAPQVMYGLPVPVIRVIVWTIGLSPIAGIIIYCFTAGRKSSVVLGPGDVDYDAAVELADKGNINFRRVIVLKSSTTTNAFARLDGTLALTQGARQKLSDSDRRCIIAHELGHVKGRHVPYQVVLSVGIWAIFFWLQACISALKLPEAIAGASRLLTSPILFIPILMIVRSPFQRKAEFAADKYALEVIGNFTDVAVALSKVHLQNASPHTFTKFHESIASHPSLVKRLNALRDTAIQMGHSVPEEEVQRIIETLTIEAAPTVVPSM